jgi:hypothetical protein
MLLEGAWLSIATAFSIVAVQDEPLASFVTVISIFGQIPPRKFQGDSRCGFDQELELL